MITNKHHIIISAIVVLTVSFLVFSSTLATSKDDIVFPIAELGNCASKQQCRAYCDEPENILACIGFAEKHNLMSEEEIRIAKKFSAIKEGPGRCASHDSCEAYCNDISHMDECIAFAEEHNIMPENELEEAKKVQAALATGATLPGGCTNKDQCEAYCEDSNHMEECIVFAETAGFIPPDELENAKKALSAIKKGIKPPSCRGEKECDVYCAEAEHFDECVTFAEAAGFMSTDEAKMVRKTGGKGPGDCKGREECEAFCEDPTHQDECFNFAQEHGLVPEEDMHKMEEGRQTMMEGFNNAPPQGQMPYNQMPDGQMMPGQMPDGTNDFFDNRNDQINNIQTYDEMMQEMDTLESEIFEDTPTLEKVLDDIPIDSLGGLLIKILYGQK